MEGLCPVPLRYLGTFQGPDYCQCILRVNVATGERVTSLGSGKDRAEVSPGWVGTGLEPRQLHRGQQPADPMQSWWKGNLALGFFSQRVK